MLISLGIMSLATTAFALALLRAEPQWGAEEAAEGSVDADLLLPVVPLM